MSGFPAAFAWQASATQAECKHRICGKRLGCRASLIHAFALSAYLGGVVVEDAAEASQYKYPATQRCLCKFLGRQTLAGDARFFLLDLEPSKVFLQECKISCCEPLVDSAGSC